MFVSRCKEAVSPATIEKMLPTRFFFVLRVPWNLLIFQCQSNIFTSVDFERFSTFNLIRSIVVGI